MKKDTKEKIYIRKCESCGKEIKSLYEKQAEYLMKQHKLSCEEKDEK